MISALLNALLNAVLIPKFHIYGAAVATVCSYVIAWGIRYIVLFVTNNYYINYNVIV